VSARIDHCVDSPLVILRGEAENLRALKDDYDPIVGEYGSAVVGDGTAATGDLEADDRR